MFVMSKPVTDADISNLPTEQPEDHSAVQSQPRLGERAARNRRLIWIETANDMVVIAIVIALTMQMAMGSPDVHTVQYISYVCAVWHTWMAATLQSDRYINESIMHKMYMITLTMLEAWWAMNIAGGNPFNGACMIAGASIRLLLATVCVGQAIKKSRSVINFNVVLDMMLALMWIGALAMPSNARFAMIIGIVTTELFMVIAFCYCIDPNGYFVEPYDHLLQRIGMLTTLTISSSVMMLLLTQPISLSSTLAVNQKNSDLNESNNTIKFALLLSVMVLSLCNMSISESDIALYHAMERALEQGLIWCYLQCTQTAGAAMLGVGLFMLSIFRAAGDSSPLDVGSALPSDYIFNDSLLPTDSVARQSTELMRFSERISALIAWGSAAVMFSFALTKKLHRRRDYEMIRCIDCSAESFMGLPIHTLLNLLHWLLLALQLSFAGVLLLVYYAFDVMRLRSLAAANDLTYMSAAGLFLVVCLSFFQDGIIAFLSKRKHLHHVHMLPSENGEFFSSVFDGNNQQPHNHSRHRQQSSIGESSNESDELYDVLQATLALRSSPLHKNDRYSYGTIA